MMHPDRRRPILATIAATLLPLLAGCGGFGSDDTNVVLISLDTTRLDHLSTYGYERSTSPVLDELAREGARFDLAYAPIATTGPSHSTMFTSLYPVAHHVVKNGVRLSDDCETLAELLSERGYQTAAIISSFVLTDKFGYAQGFDHFEDDFTPEGSSIRESSTEAPNVRMGFDRRADDASRRAIRWLEKMRDPESPFFLFVHYFDPHAPYTPPPEFKDRFLDPEGDDRAATISSYDEEIAFTDQQVGLLLKSLERLRLAEDTIVIVTADHGEGLGQHGHQEHGVNVYDEAVRVPLVFRWPDRIPAGSVHTAPVELVDLAPTVMDLVGIPTVSSFQGRSLSSALLGETSLEENRPVFLHRRHYSPKKEGGVWVSGAKLGVRLGRWKLILGPEERTFELYDLEADPDEEHNRYHEEPETVARMTGILKSWRDLVAREGEGEYELSEEDRRRLEALGYTE